MAPVVLLTAPGQGRGSAHLAEEDPGPSRATRGSDQPALYEAGRRRAGPGCGEEIWGLTGKTLL